MGRGRKNTKAVVETRRAAIEQRMMIGPISRLEQKKIGEKWGIAARTVRQDMGAVARGWREGVEADKVIDHRARLLAESHALKQLCMRGGKEGTALRCLEFQAQLTGANSPLEVNVSHSVDRGDPAQVAARVIKALPMACQVLGLPVPELPEVIDADYHEGD
jgi:hypothetical protein